jgi:hypothetical protein
MDASFELTLVMCAAQLSSSSHQHPQSPLLLFLLLPPRRLRAKRGRSFRIRRTERHEDVQRPQLGPEVDDHGLDVNVESASRGNQPQDEVVGRMASIAGVQLAQVEDRATAEERKLRLEFAEPRLV